MRPRRRSREGMPPGGETRFLKREPKFKGELQKDKQPKDKPKIQTFSGEPFSDDERINKRTSKPQEVHTSHTSEFEAIREPASDPANRRDLEPSEGNMRPTVRRDSLKPVRSAKGSRTRRGKRNR